VVVALVASVDAYHAAIARRMGVAWDDVEDVLQEAAIRAWLRPGVGMKALVRRAAIDWLRLYGPHSRRGTVRQNVSLFEEAAWYDPYPARDRWLDVRRFWPRLSRRQRQCIRAVVMRETTNLEQVHAYQGRQRLRAWCA
jgi:DNA-directed RNA polymerase specialized sigma24 family protein